MKTSLLSEQPTTTVENKAIFTCSFSPYHPQADAAASRRRELQTATGRADIARTVLRLKTNAAIATAAAATAAAGEATSKTETLEATTATGLQAAPASSLLGGGGTGAHTLAPAAVAALRPVEAEAGAVGAVRPVKVSLDADGEAGTTAPAEASPTPTTPAAAAAARAAEKERKALVDKGVQLFGLFDGGSPCGSFMVEQ